MQPDLSLVIACYNEAPHLMEGVQEVVTVLEDSRFTFEIIFVEDCSRDNTRTEIERAVEAYPQHTFRTIYHEANTGRGKTVTDGFRAASGTVLGFIDIDLEVHARYVPSMVRAVLDGADVAVANRIYTFSFASLVRYVLSKGYSRCVRTFLGLPFADTEAGYKFFRKASVMPMVLEIADHGWFWDTEFMARAFRQGLRVVEIPCLFIKSHDKKSTVRLFHDTVVYFISLMRFRIRYGRRLRNLTPTGSGGAGE